MKKAAKKLIISVFVLVVALSLAVTSTFAWFTMSTAPLVEGFQVNVTTSEGLLVSLTGDDGSYTTKITESEIETFLFDAVTGTYGSADYLLAHDNKPFKLDACYSEDGIDFYNMNATAVTEKTKYLSFNLYFKSNVEQVLTLKYDGDNPENNTYVSSTKNTSETATNPALAQAWQALDPATLNYGVAHTATIDEGADIVASAANATRISFVDGASSVVWNPNPDKGFNNDVNYSNAEVFTAANLALDYYNHLNYTTTAMPAWYACDDPDTDTLPFSNNYASVVEGSENYIIKDDLITLDEDAVNGGYKGTLTVNIWLEGYDGDCFESICDEVLTIALQFQGTEV